MTFKQKDIVYFDDTRLIVMFGPYRDWEYPTLDQYVVGYADPDVPEHLWGRQGKDTTYWASDLMSEAEYQEFQAELAAGV